MSLVSEHVMFNAMEGQDHFVRGARIGLPAQSPCKALTPTAETWSTFLYEETCIPKIVADRRKELTAFFESPVLPREGIGPLEGLLKAIDANIQLVAPVLTEAAKRLPQQYNSPESMNGVSWSWMIDLFHNRRQALKPRAKSLSEAIRSYSLAEDVKTTDAG